MFRKSQKKPAHDKAMRLGIKHYFEQTNKNWRFAYTAIALTGIGNILIFFIPTLILAKLVSRITANPDISVGSLLTYVAVIGTVWLTGEMLQRLAYNLEAVTSSRGIRTLYENAMEHLLKKDTDFFNNNFAGSLTKNVGAYARNYERFYGTIAFEIAPNVIPIVFAAIILATYSPYISLVLVGMMTLGCAIALPVIKERRRLVKLRETANTELIGHVADVIGNAAAVRSFAHESTELDSHKKNVNHFVTTARRSWDYQTNVVDMIVGPIYVLTNILGLVTVILIGKNSGELSTEAILVTFGFFSAATRAFFNFNQIYRNLEGSLTEAAQFTQYIITDPAIQDKTSNTLNATSGDIVFKNVTFAYHDDKKRPVFSDFNLHIKPGESIGLVGHSGSGKTTITKLIQRLVDIDKGEILIDSQNIAEITQKSLRQAISTVPQEPIMFHRTISENIAYGRPDATLEEIEAVAKLAHAHEFIAQLPQGYQTTVGERGIKLSGGQRQRIAIARAMIKEAPILVLDEATSALDSESELLIQEALWKLMEKRTSIVIAHRLSTVQKMDRILVIENGAIVEQGSHKELLDKKGVYAKLWGHQSGGFLEE